MNDNKPTCTIEDLTVSGAIIVPDTNIFDVYKGNMPLPPGGHYVIPNDVIVELEAYSRKFGMLTELPPEVFNSGKSELPQKNFVKAVLTNKEKFLPNEEVIKTAAKIFDIVGIVYAENNNYICGVGGEPPSQKDKTLLTTAIAQAVYSPNVALCSSDVQLGLTANFVYRAIRSCNYTEVGRLLRGHHFVICSTSRDKNYLEVKFNSREGDPDKYRFRDDYNDRRTVENLLNELKIGNGCVDFLDEKRLAITELLLNNLPGAYTKDLSEELRSVSNLNVLSGDMTEARDALKVLSKIAGRVPDIEAKLAKFNIAPEQLDTIVTELAGLSKELTDLEKEYGSLMEQLQAQKKRLSRSE